MLTLRHRSRHMNSAMRIRALVAAAILTIALSSQAAVDPKYRSEIVAWRAKAEKSLRSDNGWLTLAGRHELSMGVNTVGTAPDNKIVLAPGLAPPHLGTITVLPDKVMLKLEEGIEMFNARSDPIGFSERTLKTDLDRRDWVYLGRLSFHVIKRE